MLSSLAALIIISSIEDAGALNTVALGLAILAFVVQLIVYIVQTATAGQQLMQAQQLHGATVEILAQIQEKSEGTQATVTTINEKLLAHVLGKTLPEASATGVDPYSPEFSEIVADRVTRRMAEIQQRVGRSAESSARQPEDEEKNAELVRYMRRYPRANEVDVVKNSLESLDPELRKKLHILALDDVLSHRTGNIVYPGLAIIENESPLWSSGLVEPSPSDPYSYILTPEGRKGRPHLHGYRRDPRAYR